MAHCAAHKERKDERNDIVAVRPDVDVDGVKDEEEREAP